MPLLKLGINPAHAELARLFPKSFSLRQGLPVALLPGRAPGFEISRVESGLDIQAGSLSDYFRALGELAFASPPFGRRVAPPLEFRGQMIDCSRNGVIRPSALKDSIAELALLGYNRLCLYTEDTYEVKGEPLIGYRRGRYSQAELRDLDRHAARFGIEMFPCIQALGHLSQILKFSEYQGLKDTDHVFNVKKPETYALIEKMIASASQPYRSRLTHLGMDETWDLGRGGSFTPGKAIFPRRLYLEHVRKVAAICRRQGLKPMMWGDMLLSKHLGKGSKETLPKDMNVVYWNYYSEKGKDYARDIAACRKQGYEPVVAPGTWNWDRMWGQMRKATRTSATLMIEAKKAGVKGALMTLWGDDGQEAPYRSNFPSQVHFAEQCWRVKPRLADIRRMTLGVSGGAPFAAFEAATRLDVISAAGDQVASNTAKALLYDDPLQRLYASHAKAWDLQKMYEGRARDLMAASKSVGPKNRRLFAYINAVAGCLAAKAGIGNQAAAAYRKGDRKKLRAILLRVPALRRKIQAAWAAHRAIWLEEKKPFGLESLDIRYGGMLTRLEAFKLALSAWLSGSQSRIEEFDEADQQYRGKFPAIALWKTHAAVSTISTGH